MYGLHCFKAFPAQTWPDAQAACQKENGNLASVHNDGVNMFLQSIQIKTHLWIGGSRIGKGPWTWLDGSCFDFTGWRKGEPNGAGGECIMQVQDAKEWDDAPCHWKLGYFCQKSVTVTGKIPST